LGPLKPKLYRSKPNHIANADRGLANHHTIANERTVCGTGIPCPDLLVFSEDQCVMSADAVVTDLDIGVTTSPDQNSVVAQLKRVLCANEPAPWLA